MAQVQPAQERVARLLRGAGDVSSAVGLGLGEPKELVGAASGVRPDPAMEGQQESS